MGRHSNGQNNYRVSKGLIAFVAALIVAVVAFSVWYTQTDSESRNESAAKDTSRCINGELILPVASNQPDAARAVIDAYNEAGRVVRDYCVTASYADEVTYAGVYLSDESDAQINQALQAAGRSAATLDWPVVAAVQLGVASKDPAVQYGDFTDVRYPVASDQLGSALVAADIVSRTGTGSDAAEAVAQALEQDRDQTVDDLAQGQAAFAVAATDLPDDWSFIPAGADVQKPLRSVALNATDQVDEETIRAGADFGAAIAENAESALPRGFGTAAEALAALDAGDAGTRAGEADQAASSARTNTLIVLDTSSNVAGAWLDAQVQAAGVIAGDAAPEHAVGLWNYSSPLNPGVTQGWRANIALAQGVSAQDVSATAAGFGTGGQPLTRSAATAALLNAVDYAVATGEEVTVVLFTSGTADAQVVEDVAPLAAEAGVHLQVYALGQSPVDEDLKATAQATGGTYTSVASPEELVAAVK